MLSKKIGMKPPMVDPTTKFPHIASITTSPNTASLTNRRPARATMPPIRNPLIRPTVSSLPTTDHRSASDSSESAIRRIVTARAWVPELPPRPAIMGMTAARITIRSIVSRNRKTTEAPMSAVRRFSASHGRRRRAASRVPPRISSSSETAAKRRMSSVVSASITSITSSNVIRPTSRSISSTTPIDARLYRERMRPTSSWSMSTGTTPAGCSVSWVIGSSGSASTRSRSVVTPRSRRSEATTKIV